MRFLVDASMSPVVARELVSAGHDAIHVRDLDMSSADDVEIFELAASKDRVVVAADTDFGELLAKAGSTKPSLILFRRLQGHQPSLQARLLLQNLSVLEADLLQGAVAVIEDDRVRVRQLPIP